MFDLILDKIERPYRRRSPRATAVSVVGHVIIISTVIVLPLLYATDSLPKVPVVMMAFVAPPAAPPPPPPPPPPPAQPTAGPRRTAPVRTSANPDAAPIAAPAQIKPEPATPPSSGEPGGVEGGIEGGVAGGIVGGLVAAAPPPPPPPPPPPAPSASVRIGGKVIAPALLRRVEPDYPPLAVAAHLQGMVILEATVDTEGRVTDVRILRSIGLLDKAAIEAVKQWRYAPLTLNGVATPFVLTVTLNFALKQQRPLDIG